LSSEDRRALRAISRVTPRIAEENPAPPVSDPRGSPADCGYDASALLAASGSDALGDRIIACYGRAASNIPWDGKVIDRLTVFALLGETAGSRDPRAALGFARSGVAIGERG
jgi:hypothetical protein